MTHCVKDDGDLIRGLGYVVLYAAYLEESIDDCLAVILAHDEEFDQRIWKRSSSQKIDYLCKQLRRYEPLSKELEGFTQTLIMVNDLLEQRNLFIHGRIYAIANIGDVRVSSRRGRPETLANSAELYCLANDLYAACSPLHHASMFSLLRHISGEKSTRSPRTGQ